MKRTCYPIPLSRNKSTFAYRASTPDQAINAQTRRDGRLVNNARASSFKKEGEAIHIGYPRASKTMFAKCMLDNHLKKIDSRKSTAVRVIHGY